jgi:hypothetical protein
VNKSRKIRWAGNVAHMADAYIYVEKLRIKDNLVDRDVDGFIVLKYVFKKLSVEVYRLDSVGC